MFPTLVGYHNNTKFTNDVLPIANKILDGRDKNYLGHVNTYNDQEINQRLNEVKFLCDYINFISYDYAKRTGWIIQGETELMLFVSNMRKGEYMHSHTHPSSIISGICYLDCDEGAAPIIFEDSRDIRSFNGMISEGQIDNTKYNQYNGQEKSFIPRNGNILVWESWIRHVVRNNEGNYRKTLVWNLYKKHD